MKALVNAEIYPRPFNLPRLEPEGRCCEAIADAERLRVVHFERGSGMFSIVDPQGLAITIDYRVMDFKRVVIPFCPFCGFQWNERNEGNKILVQRGGAGAAGGEAR